MCYTDYMKRNQKIVFDDKTGYLIKGIHLITLEELAKHEILGGNSTRKKLICSLKEACEIYWRYGINEIYANGSFSTMKPLPNDIDGYIVVDTQSQNFKDLINSGSIWGNFKGKDGLNDKFPMWYEYKIEFYLENKFNTFHDFFTCSRDGIERGILKIVKGGKND